MSESLYSYELPGGGHWSLRLRPGLSVRFTDVDGGGNLGLLMYNPENLLEKYNAPDTLKAQHTFKLSRGHCLYSDMGRIFCSIVEDSLGWHDTTGGTSTAATVAHWGKRDYQNERNQWLQNGFDSFLVELAKYGLSARDLAANLNLFSKTQVDADGNLSWQPAHSSPGDSVTLRVEMDTLMVMHACPHPLNNAQHYPHQPIKVDIFASAPMAEDDICLNHCAENRRGFANNRLYYLGVGA